MLTAEQVAALIAAVSFAVLAGAGVYTLVKLARLISAAAREIDGLRARGDAVITSAQAAVDRVNAATDAAGEQLARTDAVTANMDRVSASVAELTADMSLLTAAVRTLVGGPLGRLAGLAYGVRHAIALRRARPPAHQADRGPGRPAGHPLGMAQPQALVPAQRGTGGAHRTTGHRRAGS